MRVQAELLAAARGQTPQPAPPRFVTLMNDVSTPAGRPVRFEVTVSGQPLPQVAWFRDGQPIQNSRDFQVKLYSTLTPLFGYWFLNSIPLAF